MENENANCSRITFDSGGDKPSIILGIISSKDSFFMNVQTSNKTHSIQISRIISIESTNIPFRKGVQNGYS